MMQPLFLGAAAIFSSGWRHIKYMEPTEKNTALFLEIMRNHDALIYKVCYMYAEDEEHLRDLRQEVAANVWCGLDRFNGLSKVSTWVYRIALNTCITYFRRHGKHSAVSRLDDAAYVVADNSDERRAQLNMMYELIGRLGKIDKAIVMLWLDEHSYDEISEITGLTRSNVASRLHRIKHRLSSDSES